MQILTNTFTPKNYQKCCLIAKKMIFSLLHTNLRSLSKNKSKLEEFLIDLDYQPEEIAISETKLSINTISNIDIKNYNFLNTDSSTNAGGVGLYLKDTITYRLRNDLRFHLDNCEDLWIEIKTKKTNDPMILAIIYHLSHRDIHGFQPNYVIH